MSDNTNLKEAKRKKDDEFYTQYPDIEREVLIYEHNLKGKVVYCNCDSKGSAFFKYFVDNFYRIGLKKVICSHWIDQQVSLFDKPADKPVAWVYDSSGTTQVLLKGDGSYDSPECIEFLKESDVVITNPPFSKIIGYIDTLVHYKKDFLIVAGLNVCGYSNVFPLFRDNKVRTGYYHIGNFVRPDGSIQHVAAIWLTTLSPNKKRELNLEMSYYENTGYYKIVDGTDIINVNSRNEIPVDYEGLMAVPVTYLERHDPDRFEILYHAHQHGKRGFFVDGEYLFTRIVIRKKM